MQKILLLLFAIFAVGCATQPSKKSAVHTRAGQTMKIKTTAYTHTERGGGKNAIGARLSRNAEKSASADWAKFPLGTKFQIVSTGEIYCVDDYGSALIGKQVIDLYQPSRISMRNWGVRYVDIKILEWGSPEKSLQVLLPRSHNPHVRSMINDLREQI